MNSRGHVMTVAAGRFQLGLRMALILVLCFAAVSILAASGNDFTGTMMSGGHTRTWMAHVPRNPPGKKLLPLVIALHGGGGTGKNMLKLTLGGLNRLADREGFVVIYPDGIDRHWNCGRNAQETGYRSHRESIDDVGFISALIDTAIQKYDVDPKRVYVTGMSNGAIAAYRLAGELSAKIAAIAAVAGNIAKNLVASYNPANPVSILVINNVNDPMVPYNGGDITGPFGFKKLGKVVSTAETVRFWVKYNGCRPEPVITSLADQKKDVFTKIRRETYTGGKNGTEVVLYAIEGGGHTWPGGLQYLGERIIGRTSRVIDANEVIWEFFKSHSKN